MTYLRRALRRPFSRANLELEKERVLPVLHRGNPQPPRLQPPVDAPPLQTLPLLHVLELRDAHLPEAQQLLMPHEVLPEDLHRRVLEELDAERAVLLTGGERREGELLLDGEVLEGGGLGLVDAGPVVFSEAAGDDAVDFLGVANGAAGDDGDVEGDLFRDVFEGDGVEQERDGAAVLFFGVGELELEALAGGVDDFLDDGGGGADEFVAGELGDLVLEVGGVHVDLDEALDVVLSEAVDVGGVYEFGVLLVVDDFGEADGGAPLLRGPAVVGLAHVDDAKG
mmetsp:Transcript_10919/g.27483  ORF Transcript_10919/g.27483 Transcript_10919/m.27483 type:complete len:282 (-) Transcript_10919:696-1541(-)